jgi:LmbE family N-acetylglucosaminyl deacetylase
MRIISAAVTRAPADPLSPVERVLVVTAHPDDVDYDAAGAVAAWTSGGVQVAYCIVTFGDGGGFDDTPRERVAPLREAEQRAAAALVGVADVTFLGYPDGHLTPSQELRREITRQIRRVRPQLVLTHSPQRNYRRVTASHPDHLAVGEATLCAVYPDARNPFAHPDLLSAEGQQVWAVPEVWLMGGPGADRWVDITDTFDRKLAALQAHASQVKHFGDGLERMLRERGGAAALAGGLNAGRLAEPYETVVTAE